MLTKILKAVFGSKSGRDVKRLRPLISKINELEVSYQKLSEEELKAKTQEFKDRLKNGETTDDIMCEAFAVVKNACRRLCGTTVTVCDHELVWDMIPFDVQMIGAVGNDSCGMVLKKNLESVGVKTDGLAILDGETTGQAFITVDSQGENSIIIIAGTNGLVTRELIDQNRRLIEESDIVIMQLEIPLEVVEYVKELAVSLGKLVIVDPAPAVEGIPDHFWKGIDFIKPNETELAILTGQERKNREELEEGARQMLAKGVKGVLVSLGGDGCLLVQELFQSGQFVRRCRPISGSPFRPDIRALPGQGSGSSSPHICSVRGNVF